MTKGRAWWESKREELSQLRADEFAEKYGVGTRTIDRWRARLKVSTDHLKSTSTRPDIDWGKVDFTRPDAENAIELKCSRTAVRDQRYKRFGREARAPMSKQNDWSEWSEGALDEIRIVLERNATMPPDWLHIPLRKMVDRLKDHWQIDASTATVARYCREQLGRDWT